MNVQEFYEDSSEQDRTVDISSASLFSHVLVAYPGERISFSVSLNSPIGYRLRIHVEDLPTKIASVTASPKESIALFTSSIDIHINPGAPLGVYTFKLMMVDLTTNILLGRESIAFIVLRRGIPKTLARHYQKLKALYSTYGAQALAWYILTHVFRNSATFTQIKHGAK